jgi:hypothetical protein
LCGNYGSLRTGKPTCHLKRRRPGKKPFRRADDGSPTRFTDCDDLGDDACSEAFLVDLAERAWRRPLALGEVADLLALRDNASRNGVEVAATFVFFAPDFYYRITTNS